jgi:rod shape-determining protein MreD
MVIRRVRLVLVVITFVVLETTVLEHLAVFDAKPSLCLLATIAIAYEEGPQTGAVFGFSIGLLLDMFLTSPAGLSALSFALTGYLLGVFQGGVVRESRGMALVLGMVGGLIGGTIFVIVGGIAGMAGYFSFFSVRVTIVAAFYDSFLAALVFPFMHWANHDPDRTRGWR